MEVQAFTAFRGCLLVREPLCMVMITFMLHMAFQPQGTNAPVPHAGILAAKGRFRNAGQLLLKVLG